DRLNAKTETGRSEPHYSIGGGIRKPGEEGHFDRPALVRRERRQCGAQRRALLAQLEHVARIGSHCLSCHRRTRGRHHLRIARVTPRTISLSTTFSVFVQDRRHREALRRSAYPPRGRLVLRITMSRSHKWSRTASPTGL